MTRMGNKIATTVLLTDEQYNMIQELKKKTGNSQNSIIRLAITEYYNKNLEER